MQPHGIVSECEWLDRRRELLAKEKEFTRLRDELHRQRRDLPGMRVGKNRLFETSTGRQTLGQLFGGRRQLIVYHFMLAPDVAEGCPSCTLRADHFDGAAAHLARRDITLLAISRAPLAQIAAFRQHRGWQFSWVSSHASDYSDNYRVSCDNFAVTRVPIEDLHGASVFYKDEWGDIFHTYSTYARGLDLLLGAYGGMDLIPHERDAAEFDCTRPWVSHHDRQEPHTPRAIRDASSTHSASQEKNYEPECCTRARVG